MAGTDQRQDGATGMVQVEQHPHEELVWEPPGPGSWSLDKGHVPRPLSAFTSEVAPEPFAHGFAETFRRYGIPAACVAEAFVNGLSYLAIRPLDPDELGTRAATAEEVLATRLWRDDLARWDEEVKPAAIRRHAELIAVDVDGIPVTGLIAHLRECRDHVADMVAQHHLFNGAAMIPVGDLVVGVEDWTGGEVTTAEVLGLLAGSSPISRGDCPELRDVAAAIASDGRAAALLDEDAAHDPAETLDALRNPNEVDAATVEAVDRWLTHAGHRILDGFDVSYPRAIERPAVLVACLRTADAATQAPPEPDVAAVRDRIPLEHRDEFDARLTEARLVYRLRDERGIYSDATANGIMRRAMLAAGTRLAGVGRLPTPELAVEATLDELVALLDEHPSAPTADVLRARARSRAGRTADDAPVLLGDPPSPPPPYELLPPAMARVLRALRGVSEKMAADESERVADAEGNRLTGVPASPGRHEGRARIVHTVDDLATIEPGDVIVAITTAEAFNLAMSFAAAVVTDQGGLLGHAAITAREYGIPAVVGTKRATYEIADGTRVVVDGTTGEVTW